MTIGEMIGQSGTMALLGMGMVLGFLVVMVGIISQVGKIFSRDSGKE